MTTNNVIPHTRAMLRFIVLKLVEDRTRRETEMRRLRRENEEQRVLLRSALWELAQTKNAHEGLHKDPRHFASHWLADRRKREA